MRTAIFVTASLKSKRLPLKIVRYIEGKPMLEHLIDRLKLSKFADRIVLCITTNPQDDLLIDIANKEGVDYFRYKVGDVLATLLGAAKKFNIDFFASVTADCPFVDPEYIDKLIKYYKKTNVDFIMLKAMPFGAFAYGVKVEALKKVCRLKKETDTEIWGPYFTTTGLFKVKELEVEDEELRHPEFRLTVDEDKDLELMREIFKRLYKGKVIPLKEVVKLLLDNPKLASINKDVYQRKVPKSVELKNETN